MRELLNKTRDFKIIPPNFKSSGLFDVIEISENEITGKVVLIDYNELDDYKTDSYVELFGVNDLGLIYFETKILSKNDNIIKISYPIDYSIIQRREYTRVNASQVEIAFKDINNTILNLEDISAGGAKIITENEIQTGKNYDIEIVVSQNMKINCALCPIRVLETKYQDKKAYVANVKFVNIESADRITLVQYAFKTKMEEQNKKY